MRYQGPALWAWLKKYQFLNSTDIITRHILRLNTLKGTARPLTGDITRLNTLLNLKRNDELPRLFCMGFLLGVTSREQGISLLLKTGNLTKIFGNSGFC